MRFRVWYHPYGYSDECDFVEGTFKSEDDAIRYARSLGWVSDVELIS